VQDAVSVSYGAGGKRCPVLATGCQELAVPLLDVSRANLLKGQGGLDVE
jgi:hypothetical protein